MDCDFSSSDNVSGEGKCNFFLTAPFALKTVKAYGNVMAVFKERTVEP